MKTALIWIKWIVIAIVVVALTVAWLCALGKLFDLGLTFLVIPLRSYFNMGG